MSLYGVNSMIRRITLPLLALSLCATAAYGKTLVVAGKLSGEVTVTQQVTFGIDQRQSELTYRFPLPAHVAVPGLSQRLTDQRLKFHPEPARIAKETDNYGNVYNVVTWRQLEKEAGVTIVFSTAIDAVLDPLGADAPFPLRNLPDETRRYLEPTKLVQSEDREIVAKALQLSAGATSESAAVDAILNFVADHIRYETPPGSYDALFGLSTRTGNCQNFAHLACALLRACGIPARAAVGLTLKDKWKIPLDDRGSSLVQGMGEGLHAWIEVFYPGLGWLPHDPQQTKRFTSTRHIKYAHGPDCTGLGANWRGAPVLPRYDSVVSSTFSKDLIVLSLRGSAAQPRGYITSNQLMAAPIEPRREDPAPVPVALPKPVPKPAVAEPKPIAPAPKPVAPAPKPVAPEPKPVLAMPKPVAPEPKPVLAAPKPVAPAPKPVAPKPVAPEPKPVASLPKPVAPEPKPVASLPKPVAPAPKPVVPVPKPVLVVPPPPGGSEQPPKKAVPAPPVIPEGDGTIVLGNLRLPRITNFYIGSDGQGEAALERETAEYVTSSDVYAQAFTLERPLRLEKVSLAMKKFGGDGTVYLDIVADDSGKPGLLKGVRSQPVYLENVKRQPGYAWLDFHLPSDAEPCAPGKYWVVLRRSGEAIMNWYYTPGKPYGGPDDTRSTARGWRWEDILTYDFVFKVEGRLVR